jgi:hypothetical protein
MTKQHKATPEQWAFVETCAPEDFAGFACILELRGRVEALEVRQQPPQDKLDRLIALDRDDPTNSLVAPPMPVPGDAEGLAEVFWGRYDQPEPVDLFARIDTLLDGIDRDECHPDGGWWQTSDGSKFGRIKLRELKELLSAAHLAKLEPVAPTDEELYELWNSEGIEADFQDCRRFARAVLARYSRPTIQPVPQQEAV